MNAAELKKEAKYLQELMKQKVLAFKQNRGEKVISPYVMGLDISKNKTGIAIINEETLKTLESYGSTVYRTDLCGEITIIVNKIGRMKVKTKKY